MTQGLYSAVSGIRANQTRMNVIANNIANVNTLGFKGSMANFATVFASTISGGTPPNGLLGGTNPRQVGNGVVVSEIASNWNQGGTQFTGRNTDMMIQGDGFFVVERVDTNNGNASTDFYLTRAGNFTLDSNGNLVTSAGNRIRGTSQLNGSVSATLGRVQIPLEFQITKAVDQNNNILDVFYSNGAPTDDPSVAGYDAGSVEAAFVAQQGYDPAAAPYNGGFVTVNAELRSFSIGTDGSITATYSNGDQITVRVDQDSLPGNAGNPTGDPTLIHREIVHRPYEGGDYAAGTYQSTDNIYGDGIQGNGTSAGMTSQMAGFEAFTGGIDQSSWPTGFDPMQGMQLQMQSATVTNPAGLVYDGANNFIIGANSGDTNFGVAGNGARGTMLAGALESSNVDISGEFTNMIVTQRGIEAASRVIRAQSEILQTIIQNTV